MARRSRLLKTNSLFLPPIHLTAIVYFHLCAASFYTLYFLCKMNKIIDEVRMMNSLRLESPEPESRQGRRNAKAAGVQLLEADGAMSLQVCTSGVRRLYQVLTGWYYSWKRV